MFRFILVILFTIPLFGYSQVKTFGTSKILNYPKSVYGVGTQNWDIAQDANGFMYFANNNGILRFDGKNWENLDTNIPLPVRSVYIDSHNRIFVGLTDNFGMLELNTTGNYEFRSLRYLIDESIGFSDVWKIHEIEQGIVFQSFEKLFIFDGDSINVYSPKEKYHFSFKVNGHLFIQQDGLGLYQYLNGVFEKVSWADPIIDDDIISILELGENSLLIGTVSGFFKYENEKLVKWECPVNDFIKTNKLFSSVSIEGNYLAFGTILNGLVISDNKGNIIQHLNKENGLQNNTLLSIFYDKDKNLWLGLDNGIDYAEINSPISYISEVGKIGTGYCCIVYNDMLYLGTNQGLFVKRISTLSGKNESFKLIQNTEGQVWSLSVYNEQLICGHHLGTFIINNDKATKISDEPGGWKYIQAKNDSNTLIGGFYSGLAIFKYGTNGWKFYKKLSGFSESTRFIVADENNYLWISHGSKGVYKISMDENLDNIIDYKIYNHASGLPSNEHNIAFLFKGKVYISTIDEIYEYDLLDDSFKKSAEINSLFGKIGRLKTLKTDDKGNLWFIGGNESGVLRLNEDLTYTKISAPFESLNGKFVNEFEFVYPYNSDQTFFAIDNGFAHYSTKFNKSYTNAFQSFITKVELPYLDSVLSFTHIHSNSQYEFPFKKNSFRFHFTSPFFENPEQLRFSFFLENFSDEWSDWSTDCYKDFTNLYEGEYSFQLKAQNIYGVESGISSFSFIVLPPWHRSQLAWLIYLALVAVLIFVIIRFVLHRIELSKKKEAKKYQMEMQKKEQKFQRQALVAEKEIIKLRNDKLKDEMIHRDKELANQTVGIVQKNKLLINISEELQYIHNLIKNDSAKTKIHSLKRRINKEIDNKQQNKIFETYFDEVHEDFFNRLKEKYPILSPNDLRLCAFIKMNLSTKEIATILNISYRGAEISRYRLRKKLDLSREINFSTFLSNI